MDVDVLVVGAGPTGLTLAEELARFGVDFRVVDSGRGPTDLSKAIGVQARTLETLDIMGLADELVRHGNPAKAFHVYDEDKRILHLDFSGLDSRFPYLLIVPQSDTERVLLDRLGAAKQPERGTTLTAFSQDASGVDATLRRADDGATENLRARWLVGCDGAHSTVRKGLGLPFEGEEYEEGFLLADVRVEWDRPDDELYLFLHEGWLSAFFPLPGGRYRIIADLPPEQAPVDRNPTLEECQRVMSERSPFPVTVSDPAWTAFYRIHRRIVPGLQQGRVFLAGDSAHIHSPAAAQGMNTGIQDAFNLAWKLALVAHGQAPDHLLDSYNAERYPVEQAVLKNTDFLLKVMSLRQPMARKLRDVLLPLLSGTKTFQEQARTRVSELGIDYHDSPIVLNRDHSTHAHAGMRAPDGLVSRENGDPVRLYEILRDGKFLALAFVDEEDRADTPLSEHTAALDSLHELANLYRVARRAAPSASAPGAWPVLCDSSGSVYESYAVTHPCVCILRPDGYIGYRANTDALDASLPEYITRLFRQPRPA